MAAHLSNSQRADATRHASRPLVLVTDDDGDTRFLFRTVLEMSGYAVVEAADGEEAVELASRRRPDLILMDGTLPRLDGLSAARRIRQLGPAGRVPIIFVSGWAEPSTRATAREAGCDECLTKPLDVDQLVRVLDRYTRRARVEV